MGAGGVFDVEQTKNAVRDWARADLAVELAGNAQKCMNELGEAGADFQGLAADINKKLIAQGSGESVTAERVALYVSESLVRGAVERFGNTAAALSKASRRRLQVRAAQQKFRSRHGNRQKYVPLGMGANIG